MSSLAIIECQVILRNEQNEGRGESLGVHEFGRIPIAGEYFRLDIPGFGYRVYFYKVTHICHVCDQSHQAEVYVLPTDDMDSFGVWTLPKLDRRGF